MVNLALINHIFHFSPFIENFLYVIMVYLHQIMGLISSHKLKLLKLSFLTYHDCISQSKIIECKSY